MLLLQRTRFYTQAAGLVVFWAINFFFN